MRATYQTVLPGKDVDLLAAVRIPLPCNSAPPLELAARARPRGALAELVAGSRDHDWGNVGFEPLIHNNFDALRSYGMTTSLKVNGTLGDVVETILLSVGMGVTATAVFLFASENAKACPGRYDVRRDPETGLNQPEWSYPVVPSHEPCHLKPLLW